MPISPAKESTTSVENSTPKKPAAKKVSAKAPAKKAPAKKSSAKAVTKSASDSKPSGVRAAKNTELKAQVFKVLKSNKEYSTREIVEALGRTPGQKEGGPVVRALKLLNAEGSVNYGAATGSKKYFWSKAKAK